MKRREFITLLSGAVAAWPLMARAQQPEQMRRIGVEAKFRLPWSFSEEGAAEKYMAQLQHNMWVTHLRTSASLVTTQICHSSLRCGASSTE